MNRATDLPVGRRRWPIVLSYLAALGMVVSFAAIFIQFLAWIDPALDISGMLAVCVLVALEAFLSFWLIRHLPTAQRQTAFFRLTEVIVLLVGLKIFTELRAGAGSFWNNVALWPYQFPFNLLNGRYILTSLPILASWQAGNLLAADLSLLGVEEGSNPDERIKITPVRLLILRRFLSLGMFVVLLAAIPPQTVIYTPLPIVSNAGPLVVIYFVFGLILISLTRYVNLETTWWQAKLKIPVQIPRRWFLYSGLILVVLVVLVRWLPTNYEFGLLGTLLALIRLLNQAVFYMYGLILLLVSLLAQLMGKPPTGPSNQIQHLPTPPPALAPGPVSTLNWNLAKSIFLWGSLIVLAVIALRQYIAFNQDLSQDLKQFRPLQWLLSAWRRFVTNFKKANKSVGEFVRNSLNRLRGDDSGPVQPGEWDFINPRRLSPRQKVIFYYLAMIRRADEAGVPRQESQTPYEYSGILKTSLPDEKDGLDTMTEAFIEARYSRHEIPARQASRLGTVWANLRQVLRKVRKSHNPDKAARD